jgi:hypothetical protein
LKKFLVLFCVLLVVSSLAFSQTATAKIIGAVTDTDGGPLPGVTVTLTGEKIGKTTTISSEEGNFRFLNLPVGKNYIVRFELGGFNTVVRKGIDLWIGATSKVNVIMKLTTVIEEIIVTASTPLVDTKATTVAANVSAEKIKLLPTSRNPWTIMNLAPGMLIDREDVGGNESGQQSAYYGHGVSDNDSTWRIDGANITDASAIGAAPAYLNMNAYEELQISYGSNDITAQTGGVQLNFVTKRSGNAYSGTFHMNVEDEKWQLDNLSKHPEEDLKPGYESPGIFRLYMYGADFGGPIIKDHLFFYGSWAIQDIHSRTIVGSEDETWLVSGYGKINWQYGDNMGDIFISYDNKNKWGRSMLGAANQGPGTLWDQTGPGYLFRLSDQHIFGNLLISLKAIYTDGGFCLDPRGNDIEGGVAVGEDWWIYFTPSNYYDGSVYHYETNRNQIDVALDGNYFAEDLLGGDHEIKFGVDYVTADTTTHTYYPNQAMIYRYSDFGYPFDVYEANTNGVFDVTFKRYSAYLSDTVTFGKFTLTLGIRYDVEQGSHNAAKAPGFSIDGVNPWPDYLGPISAPAGDIDVKWKTISPRLNLVYDVTGDGKNVVKLALARYGSQSGNNLAAFMWVVGTRYIAVPWYDLNSDGKPQIGEFSALDPENAFWYGGFDRTDPYNTKSANRFDPNFSTPLTDELTLTYEREITSDFAASLTFFYKKRHNLIRTIGIMEDGSLETAANWYLKGNDPNLDQPYYERYEIPVASYRTNTDKTYTQYLACSLVLKKRFSHKWMMDASVTISDWKSIREKSEYFDLTNFDYYNEGVVAPGSGGSGLSGIYVNSRWMVKISGLYQLPYEINLSAVFNAREGYVIPYYSAFRRGSGIGTTNMYESGKKFGDDRLPIFWVLNLGLEKVFHVLERAKVAFHIDAFNVTNNATILKRNPVLLTTATDRIERFLNPTVFQFGIRFEF